MLKVTTEPLENCEVLMTVDVDEGQTDQLLKAAARRISRQVRIPGFRPGRAPYHVIVQRVGEEVLRDEALQDLSQSVFKQALEQSELEPYAQASLEEVSWDPLVMKVRVPVAPIVELGDYRSLRMEPEPVEVSQEEVDEALEDLQGEHAVWNSVERPARLGDLVTMAVTEQVGDEVLKEDDNTEYELVEVEEDSAEPDLTTPLIGLSAGEEKEFTLAYPEAYDEPQYAGQEVTVSVEVHGVKEKELYPLDDDFAQTVGDFDTLEQLSESLAEDIRRRKEEEADRELGWEALEQIVDSAERVEWPTALEEEEIDQALEQQDHQLEESGLNLDTYLIMQKKTREQLREELRPRVREQLRRSLALGELLMSEGISVAGHEISDRIDVLSSLAGERGEELREALTAPDNIRSLASNILITKLVDRLAQIVKGEFVAEVEEEEAESETGTAQVETETQEEADAESVVNG